MTPATIWWLLAAILVALELTTGTFYLLMLAIGAVVGALAAHLNLDATWQIALSALSAGAGVVILNRWRAKHHAELPHFQANRDVNLDVGERVTVRAWNDDKTAKAYYRGSEWLVRYQGDDVPQPGEHRIVALEGNRLVVQK